MFATIISVVCLLLCVYFARRAGVFGDYESASEISRKAEEARQRRIQGEYDREVLRVENEKKAKAAQKLEDNKPSKILAGLIATRMLLDSVQNPSAFKPGDGDEYIYFNEDKKWSVIFSFHAVYNSRKNKHELSGPEKPKYLVFDGKTADNFTLQSLRMLVGKKEIEFNASEQATIGKAIRQSHTFMGRLEASKREAARQHDCVDAIAGYMDVEKPPQLMLPSPEEQLMPDLNRLLEKEYA